MRRNILVRLVVLRHEPGDDIVRETICPTRVARRERRYADRADHVLDALERLLGRDVGGLERAHAAAELIVPTVTTHAALSTTRPLLDTDQVATLLGLRPNTLAQWRMTGSGPTFVRLGRRVRYRAADIDAWIESQARRSTSDPGRST